MREGLDRLEEYEQDKIINNEQHSISQEESKIGEVFPSPSE